MTVAEGSCAEARLTPQALPIADHEWRAAIADAGLVDQAQVLPHPRRPIAALAEA